MKQFLILLFMLFLLGEVNAQRDKERIEALKTAFITQEMNLNNKVAQKFWPVYNEYETRRWELHEEERNKLKDPDCITEKEAKQMLSEYLEIERKEYVIKKQLFEDLKEIFTAKEIIKLNRLEDEFHRKLIQEFRAKKDSERQNSKK